MLSIGLGDISYMDKMLDELVLSVTAYSRSYTVAKSEKHPLYLALTILTSLLQEFQPPSGGVLIYTLLMVIDAQV